MFKAFKVWRKSIQWRKFQEAKSYLEKNLFLAQPSLARALLRMQEEYCRLEKMKFCEMPYLQNWHIFYFYEVQMAQIEHGRDLLLDFRRKMKDVLCKLLDFQYANDQLLIF
jgi:dynein heavy chain